MAFIKIYSNEHLDDVGMCRCWSVNLRYKFEKSQQAELERAVKKIASDNLARLGDGNIGYQVNAKSVKIWHADRDPQGEYLARNISDDLLKLVNHKWSVGSDDDGYKIDPGRFGEPLV